MQTSAASGFFAFYPEILFPPGFFEPSKPAHLNIPSKRFDGRKLKAFDICLLSEKSVLRFAAGELDPIMLEPTAREIDPGQLLAGDRAGVRVI
jgi:hypothetical protein